LTFVVGNNYIITGLLSVIRRTHFKAIVKCWLPLHDKQLVVYRLRATVADIIYIVPPTRRPMGHLLHSQH